MVVLAMKHKLGLLSCVLLCLVCVGISETNPGDYAIIDAFRKGLDNPELLKWPSGDEDPCGSRWPHVFCNEDRVAQIQVAELGLKGPLPENFNQLTELFNIGLQRNSFTGKLPSFKGLSKLQFAYLGNNQFDTIPADFFVGLDNLQALSLEKNPLNQSQGWVLPKDLANSAQLSNLTLSQCNLAGTLPEFLGDLSSLTNLKLSYNRLTGVLPASFSNLGLQTLWLNNQDPPGLTGPIDVIASIPSLTSVWLHGNSFTGTIPPGIAECTSLNQLWLNNNKLVGPIPENLTTMSRLQSLQLDNNMLTGPIPKLPNANFTYAHNSFCQSAPGSPCAPEVAALLDFLGAVNFPVDLASSWSGDDPCSGTWIGVSCLNQKVCIINLPNRRLSGFISASIGKLDSLMDIRLGGNNVTGIIPPNLTLLKSLRTLNLTSNNIAPPIPKFSSSVKLLIDDNPLLSVSPSPSPGKSSPSERPPSSGGSVDTPASPNSPAGPNSPSRDAGPASSNNTGTRTPSKGSMVSKVVTVVAPISVGLLLASLVVFFVLYRQKKHSRHVTASSIVIHPKDPSDRDNMVKIVVAENSSKLTSASDIRSVISGASETHVIESGSLVISVQTLRNVTGNFDSENELGRGGFGVVYKGVFDDGSTIAVKRMEAAVISSKALDEFQSEIAVLSKVRHRNLVSLLGYSIEANEKLLVYEYMPQGALSKHLFQWQKQNLEPLSWKRRLTIALDVARGLEYLHNLAHQSFIHRDLKSSNILLDDDHRAKISDFGLVKLAPDGKNSVATKLAGTFGYLAPEYAVTGKVTTKSDVFSFGVVLMELVTGLIALDENRSEESQYLASWFFHVKSSRETLMASVDPSIEVTDETSESICIVAELAGHCAAREPQQRPDMGHAVTVLSPLVGKWKPVKDDQEENLGIDLSQPLLQMVKGWQASDTSNVSSVSLDDSKGSIPARPAGFAESFTSSDGR